MTTWVDNESQSRLNDNDEVKESQLIPWLKQNNLDEAIEAFRSQNITLDDLIELEEEQHLDTYLQKLNVSDPLCIRMNAKMQKLSKSRPNKQDRGKQIAYYSECGRK